MKAFEIVMELLEQAEAEGASLEQFFDAHAGVCDTVACTSDLIAKVDMLRAALRETTATGLAGAAPFVRSLTADLESAARDTEGLRALVTGPNVGALLSGIAAELRAARRRFDGGN